MAYVRVVISNVLCNNLAVLCFDTNVYNVITFVANHVLPEILNVMRLISVVQTEKLVRALILK